MNACMIIEDTDEIQMSYCGVNGCAMVDALIKSSKWSILLNAGINPKRE